MRIVNGTVFAQDQLQHGLSIAFQTNVISAMGTHLPEASTYDATGCYVVPGFIDIHIHGFAGRSVMEGEAAVRHMAATLPQHGTTAFLAGLTSAPIERMRAVVEDCARVCANPGSGATVLGMQLEGPFFNPIRKGATNPEAIIPASLESFEAIAGAHTPLIRQIAMATEMPGALAFVDAMVAQGIRVACGHTDASYEQALEAVAHGASVATHTFNAMSPLSHREPGMAGAALACPQLYAEFIADFVHLHPAAVRLILTAKGRERAIAITDCTTFGGLKDTDAASVPGRQVTVRDGAPRLPDGTLAGSCLTLDQSLRNVVHGLGIPLEDALPCYTANPARMLGLKQRGRLAVGQYADILVLDAALRVQAVWVAGQRML